MPIFPGFLATATLGSLLLLTPAASAAEQASADMKSAQGRSLGELELAQTPNGVLIQGTLAPIPDGAHAFHVHKSGACDAATGFESAGGHFALEKKHGFRVADGPHPGDMPNLHAGSGQSIVIDSFNPRISLKEGEPGYVFDQDGSALVVHAGADDYQSQPSGEAGGRIACGVIERR